LIVVALAPAAIRDGGHVRSLAGQENRVANDRFQSTAVMLGVALGDQFSEEVAGRLPLQVDISGRPGDCSPRARNGGADPKHHHCRAGDATHHVCITLVPIPRVGGLPMKTSLLPPVRVSEELRAAAEGVLSEGETLSSFIQQSVERAVEYRRVQADFHSRGQGALEQYRRTGRSHSAADVVSGLQAKLERKRKQLRK
jgi:hypothetical protein